jgi:hypothetical protein
MMEAPLFLCEAEHPHVPGTRRSLHKTLAGANARALELCHLMLRDLGLKPRTVNPDKWYSELRRIDAKLSDDEDAFVAVIEMKVEG